MASALHNPAIYLVGATGLTGNDTFQTILASPSRFSSITTITRRPLESKLPVPSPATPHTNLVFNFKDPKTWNLAAPATSTTAAVANEDKVFVTCLGTTKAAAGSIEEQRKIDLDLNLELAKAAKAEGIETFILLSSTGASATSYSPYTKMKGELEDAVKDLGFKRTFILLPGLLVGARDHTRTLEGAAQGLFKGLRAVGFPLLDRAGVDADVLAKAIANLAHSKEEGVHYYSNQQIIKLGTA